MVRDLSDPHEFARRNQAALRRTKTPTTAQRTAVDRGAFRVKSPEGMEVGTVEDPNGSGTVYGTWTIRGLLEVLGQLTGSGSLDWTGPATIAGALSVTGPWTLSGDGDITGDVDATGDWKQYGNFEVLDNGQIKVGNVLITPGSGGRVTVGTGTRRIVIDAGTQRIQIGQTNPMMIQLDDNGNGVIEMSTGAHLNSLPNDEVEMEMRSADQERAVIVGDDNVILRNGLQQFRIYDEGLAVSSLETLPAGVQAMYVVHGSDGGIYKTSGVGGGGEGTPGPAAGDFMWPFDPSTTEPVLGMYGMRLNPVTGVWAMHQGRDFSVPAGSGIPAIGDGTIAEVSSGDARGNRVRIDHGGGLYSEYFHMQTVSPLAVGAEVSRGDIIGPVGTTGNSTGPHLHLQVWQNGGWVDPTLFFEAQSQ